MKTRISVLILAIVTTFLASASCSSPQYCAAQQSPNGPILYAYLLSLSKFYPKHPGGYLDRGLIIELLKQLQAGIYDLCGQIVCADSEAAARAAFAGAVGVANLNDPSLFVYQLGYSEAEVRVAEAPANAAWLASGAPCVGGYATEGGDAGTGGGSSVDAGPCGLLGEPCSNKGLGSAPDCCPYQQIVSGGPASNLDCEPLDVDVDDVNGYCRAGLWQPCNDASECFQGGLTPDDQPLDCQDICCIDEGRTCFSPGGGPGLEEQYGGCCPGYNCVADTIGNGYWCQ